MKRFNSYASHDITRRKLVLGNADSVTGWYAKSYTESTIEGIFVQRNAANVAYACGGYVNLDATLFTADVLEVGDQIQLSTSNDYFEVKTVEKVWSFGGDDFSHRICQLKHLPFGGL